MEQHECNAIRNFLIFSFYSISILCICSSTSEEVRVPRRYSNCASSLQINVFIYLLRYYIHIYFKYVYIYICDLERRKNEPNIERKKRLSMGTFHMLLRVLQKSPVFKCPWLKSHVLSIQRSLNAGKIRNPLRTFFKPPRHIKQQYIYVQYIYN